MKASHVLYWLSIAGLGLFSLLAAGQVNGAESSPPPPPANVVLYCDGPVGVYVAYGPAMIETVGVSAVQNHPRCSG